MFNLVQRLNEVKVKFGAVADCGCHCRSIDCVSSNDLNESLFKR